MRGAAAGDNAGMPRSPIFSSAEAVEAAFYDAMQRGDVKGLMSLWADDDTVVCVHPNGGRLVGHAAIRSSWEQIFNDGSGLSVRTEAIRTIESAVVAIHNLVERIVLAGEDGGDSEVVECVATNVYVRQAAGWRLALHHSAPGNEDELGPAVSDRVH